MITAKSVGVCLKFLELEKLGHEHLGLYLHLYCKFSMQILSYQTTEYRGGNQRSPFRKRTSFTFNAMSIIEIVGARGLPSVEAQTLAHSFNIHSIVRQSPKLISIAHTLSKTSTMLIRRIDSSVTPTVIRPLATSWRRSRHGALEQISLEEQQTFSSSHDFQERHC